jgi:pimeloyl-ACP methyl ester carboxylesterase
MPLSVPGDEKTRQAREIFGEDNPWFQFQAENLHRLDPDMLAAVLDGPEIMLEGYDPEILLPVITCPVLLLQADRAAGGLLRDEEVEMGLRLLAHPAHVRLNGIGHELHGPPGQEQRVLQAITPFLEAVRSSAEMQPASASNASQEGESCSVHSNKDEEE